MLDPPPGGGAFCGDLKWQISKSPHIPIYDVCVCVCVRGGGVAGGLQPNYAPGGGGFWRPKFQSPHISPPSGWLGITITLTAA